MPHCIVLLLVFHLYLNFKFECIQMHFFFSLSFSLGPAHSLFLFPLSPFPPARPSLAGLFLFSSLSRGPVGLVQPAPSPLPSLSCCQVGPAYRARLLCRARLGFESKSDRGVTRRAALGPHVEAPRLPYKAAAPRPRSHLSRRWCLASQTLAARVRRQRTSATVAITASSLPCCRELPPEFHLGVRVLAGLLSLSSPLLAITLARCRHRAALSHSIYKDINRAIIYAPGSSHAYIQQNHQDIITHITYNNNINRK
jgi:hypothetical protein